jgi:hypothetical protein
MCFVWVLLGSFFVVFCIQQSPAVVLLQFQRVLSLAHGMVVVVEDDCNLVGDKWRWAISHRPYLRGKNITLNMSRKIVLKTSVICARSVKIPLASSGDLSDLNPDMLHGQRILAHKILTQKFSQAKILAHKILTHKNFLEQKFSVHWGTVILSSIEDHRDARIPTGGV